jgi:hypothetical protein
MAAIPPAMFSESQFVDKNETDVEIRTVTLTKEVWTTLKDFNHKHQITNFEFIDIKLRESCSVDMLSNNNRSK